MSTIAKLLSKGIKNSVKSDYAKKADKLKPRQKNDTSAKVTMPQKRSSNKLIESGMSEGYKFRQRKQKELTKLKSQIAKQGHNKDLAKQITTIQEQIDKSYKVK